MSLPFVGRSRAVQDVRGRLARGRGVLVTGPAGIGKTRLLQALVEAAGPAVERITATDATRSIPLGACMRFLPAGAAGVDGVDALAVVRAALVELGDSGAVLAVDDADRLDALSAAVIADVVRAGVPIALCSRLASSVPTPLLALLDEGAVIELPLEPLADADAVTLVRAVARGGMTPTALHRAVELGEGNPLLLTELARVAPTAGLERVPLTERLRRAVGERLAALEPAGQRVVELLAYDAPLPLAVLTAIAGEDAVDEVEQLGVVAAGPGPAHMTAPTHPLMAEVVAERLTAARRAALGAALIGAAGDDLSHLGDATVRHARWQVDAGEISKPHLVRDAARQLLSRWDPGAAAQLATIAHQHLPDDAGPLLTLAGAAVVCGIPDEADRWYAALDRHPGASPEQRRQALLGRAEVAYFLRGDAERALATLDAAGAGGPVARERSCALRAMIALCAGRYQEATAAAAEVGAEAPADVQLIAAAVAHVAVGSAGRLREAWAITESVLPLLDDPGVSPEHHFRFAAGRQYLRLHLGEIDRMRREATAGSAAERLRLVASDFGLAYGELIAGRGDRARERLEHAQTRLGQTDPYGHRAFVGCIGAELAALQGRRTTARQAARAAADAHRPHLGWWAWAVPAAAAWAEAADLRPRHARARMRDAAARAAANGDLIHRCCCLVAAVRLGDLDAAAELAEAAAPIDGHLWPAVVLAAHGLADAADPEGCLERGCDQLIDVGAVLWGVAFLARGADLDRIARRRRAARRQAAAERHAMRLVDLSPLGLQHLRQGPQAGLTRRQREIAMLAAEGLTSREIADSLVLSVRTVDNHLARAYQVLGVASRRHLAEVLGVPIDHRP